MSASHPALHGSWTCCLTRLGCPSALAEQALADLVRRYAEPHRHYHTLEHIGSMLAVLEQMHVDLAATPALLLAVWLHDVVYDPRAGDNEEQSAAVARNLLPRLNVPADLVEETARLILLTKSHQAQPEDVLGQLLDADLSILGAREAEYDRYAAAIRQEYAWVPEDAYRQGRSRVLRQFLDRASIFTTPTLRTQAEEQARHNLQRELAVLLPGELGK